MARVAGFRGLKYRLSLIRLQRNLGPSLSQTTNNQSKVHIPAQAGVQPTSEFDAANDVEPSRRTQTGIALFLLVTSFLVFWFAFLLLRKPDPGETALQGALRALKPGDLLVVDPGVRTDLKLVPSNVPLLVANPETVASESHTFHRLLGLRPERPIPDDSGLELLKAGPTQVLLFRLRPRRFLVGEAIDTRATARGWVVRNAEKLPCSVAGDKLVCPRSGGHVLAAWTTCPAMDGRSGLRLKPLSNATSIVELDQPTAATRLRIVHAQTSPATLGTPSGLTSSTLRLVPGRKTLEVRTAKLSGVMS